MSCIGAHDPQLTRLADAIAQRVGQQRFHVWFNNSTKLEMKGDGLEIAVPNDFISEWIGTHFTRSIQEAAHEVLGCPLPVRFCVTPEMFVAKGPPVEEQTLDDVDLASVLMPAGKARGRSRAAASASLARPAGTSVMSPTRKAFGNGAVAMLQTQPVMRSVGPSQGGTNFGQNGSQNSGQSGGLDSGVASVSNGNNSAQISPFSTRPRLRHDLSTYVVGANSRLAFTAAASVAECPGVQYNPLFIHGNCGLGKTHLLQGLCKKFIEHHPTKRWMYLTGEDFTNEFLSCLRANKLDTFRRKVRDLDLLVIDDVHFLGGKKATQEEFLHTFNAIEAMGRQVVMASDNHPKMIEEFGESLINRFVSGMVVRIDPPNFATRCEILRAISDRNSLALSEEVVGWVARRVTQNVRELEGAVTRIAAHIQLGGEPADVSIAQQALGDLDRQLVAPVKPENILASVCTYFGLEHKDLMSGRRQRTISLARSVAMYLVRKTAKLSFPEIGHRMGKRNHSTVISACRRIERAVQQNERLLWTSAVGERTEEAPELLQRLEEHSRALS